MNKTHVTVLEIDSKAIIHNYHYFKSKIKPTTKFMGVVKAFAYGNEAVAIAKILEKEGVDYLAVAFIDEGIALREAGINKPILVLHPQTETLHHLLTYQLEPNLYSFRILNQFIEVIKTAKLNNYPIHVKFNTGLNRLGFKPTDVDEVISILKNNSELHLTSIFSHLVASEDLNERAFTQNQIDSFKKLSDQISKELNINPIRHLSNTSGVINYPDAHFDMVRVGIGLYGFGNDTEETSKLKLVGTLKSRISQIHTINPGESVGYNRGFISSETIKSATIPIGHADGIHRNLGNKVGYVTINNQKAYFLGNVCMDMIMVDVTNIQCEEGDEVFIFKNQENVEDLASRSNTISYEMITGISQRIPRKLIN
ncbi:MAG: alanine racemase [Flavobacteriaceae bacterium]|nr:alanine racemase [Flavobacteriaceae bacterium]